jgi:hypothetical protein
MRMSGRWNETPSTPKREQRGSKSTPINIGPILHIDGHLISMQNSSGEVGNVTAQCTGQLGRRPPSRLILEIDVGERLPVELRPLNPHHAEARVGIVVDDQDQTGW